MPFRLPRETRKQATCLNRAVQCRHNSLKLPGPFLGLGSLFPHLDAAL
jgi:hypothetical protein